MKRIEFILGLTCMIAAGFVCGYVLFYIAVIPYSTIALIIPLSICHFFIGRKLLKESLS
jgi:hypothetical protein